jgi:hypothetical protein
VNLSRLASPSPTTNLRELLWSAAPFLLEDLIEQATEELRSAFPNLDPLATLRQALS